jgi:hypothetical protein
MEAWPVQTRRKPDSRYGARSDPGIWRRQDVASQFRRRRKSERARPIRSGAVTFASLGVFDDFPQTMPVVRRELDVIETYLGELLDEALGLPG